MILSASGGHEGGMAPTILKTFHVAGYEIPLYNFVVTTWAIMLVLVLLGFFGTRNMKRLPAGAQNVVEYIVEGLMGFFGSMLGEKRGKKYMPLIGTFFLFILLSNYSGFIPGMGSVVGMAAPTSTWNTTVALALIVFFATHGFGVQMKGIGYFKHFFTPMAFLFILNLVEEIVRPVSLSLRLFGNIYGEETLAHQLGALIPYPFTGFLAPLPIMLLGLLLGAIQALVFTLLATTYIGGATEEHH